MHSDESAMRRALALALRGRGQVKPNPMVGAVVLKDGKIIGSGWHRKAGAKHAEVEALEEAGDKATGATLYVTLEPCNHHGKTPPCTEAIIKAGIKRLVCAVKDPNPEVQGGGFEELKKAGIEVDYGLLEEEARTINRGWFSVVEKSKPFVLLKLASDKNNAIAGPGGERVQISSNASLAHSQRLRGYFDAILVGVGTVLKDDPQLTNRSGKGNNPVKIVLDSELRTSNKATIFNEGEVVIFCGKKASGSKKNEFEGIGIGVVPVGAALEPPDKLSFNEILSHLSKLGIQSLLIEGGAQVAREVVNQKLCDRFLHYQSQNEIVGGERVEIEEWIGGMKMVWEKEKGGDRVKLYEFDR